MDSQHDLTRALSLAGDVLKNRMSLDEALLVANASNMLPALIESLNVLADGPAFAQAELEQRVHSGEAQWALEGRIPRLELPDGLRDWRVENQVASVDWADASLKELDGRIAKLLELERDLSGQIEFLQAVERHRPTPPNPWIAGIVIMGVGLVICVSLGFLARAHIAALLTFVLATGIGSAVSLRDWRKFEEFLDKVQREDQHRKSKITQRQKDLDNAKNEVSAVMQEAMKILERLEVSGPEVVRKTIATFPKLFWSPGQNGAESDSIKE
jgi:hypothetical protein